MEKLSLIGISRVSTAKQMQKGNSVDEQARQIEQFALEKEMNLLEIVKVQASGKKQLLNIGQLAETIKKAKSAGASIVVTKIDRLSRDQITLLMLKKASEESGIEIHVASMNRKISEISEMEFSMIAMLAEQERVAIAQRCKEAARGRIGPIGVFLDPKELAQKSVDKRIELAKGWASSVHLKKHILEAVSSLKVPNLKNVARWLNGEGLVSRRGRRWDGSNLHKQISRLGWSWKEFSK
jgi:DNA invertase Pin-like site-specific DNA recombinase